MTGRLRKLYRAHGPTVLALGALLLCLAVAAGLWLAVVRGNTQKSLSQLERSGCKILGAVLNKVDMKKDKYYSSYYGRYGDYYKHK